MEDYYLALFNYVAHPAFRPSDPGDSLVWLRPCPLAPERRLPAHVKTGVAALRRLRSIALAENGSALDDPAA